MCSFHPLFALGALFCSPPHPKILSFFFLFFGVPWGAGEYMELSAAEE